MTSSRKAKTVELNLQTKRQID